MSLKSNSSFVSKKVLGSDDSGNFSTFSIVKMPHKAECEMLCFSAQFLISQLRVLLTGF